MMMHRYYLNEMPTEGIKNCHRCWMKWDMPDATPCLTEASRLTPI